MRKSLLLVIFVSVFHEYQAVLKLPPYIKACSRSDPDFNKCAVKNGNEAISTIVKGDPKYHIPRLDPLNLDRVDIIANNIKFYVQNLTVIGFGQTELQTINWDLEKKEVYINLIFPNLKTYGNYRLSGKILVLELSGNGPFHMNYTSSNVTASVSYNLKMKSGIEYADIQHIKANFVLSGMQMYFSNLLNNEKLDKQMNAFLNENWKVFLQEISSPICEFIETVVIGIMKPICEKVPYNEIIKP